MVFNHCTSPYEASYSGPNVSNGHALVFAKNDVLNMVYHAITSEGILVAGKAVVELTRASSTNTLEMQLNWQWLTGDLSSGISKWIEING